jgi:hypothetical protein
MPPTVLHFASESTRLGLGFQTDTGIEDGTLTRCVRGELIG